MSLSEIDVSWVLINVVVLFFSLSVHECAHAWTALKLGDPTARDLGRVTINPLPHIDPIGTILFPLLGLLSGFVLFGWARPVPVNTARLSDPKRDHVFIAGAGPASNVLAAGGFLLGLWVLRGIYGSPVLAQDTIAEPLLLLCQVGLLLNVILAVFNLLPVPPLDGSWILSGLLPDAFSRLFDLIRPYGFLILVMLLYLGVFGKILGPVLAFVRRVAL